MQHPVVEDMLCEITSFARDFCTRVFLLRLRMGAKRESNAAVNPSTRLKTPFSQLLFYFWYVLLCAPRKSLEHNNWIFVYKEGITTVWFLKRTEDPTTHVSDTALLTSVGFRFVESGLSSVKAIPSRDSHINIPLTFNTLSKHRCSSLPEIRERLKDRFVSSE